MSWIIFGFLGFSLLFWVLRLLARADAAQLAVGLRLLIRGVVFSLIFGVLRSRLGVFGFITRLFPFFMAQSRSYRRRSDARPHKKAMSANQARHILGVSPQASPEEITHAWRKLMRQAHPDQGGSQEDAVRLNQARDILLKRK